MQVSVVIFFIFYFLLLSKVLQCCFGLWIELLLDVFPFGHLMVLIGLLVNKFSLWRNGKDELIWVMLIIIGAYLLKGSLCSCFFLCFKAFPFMQWAPLYVTGHKMEFSVAAYQLEFVKIVTYAFVFSFSLNRLMFSGKDCSFQQSGSFTFWKADKEINFWLVLKFTIGDVSVLVFPCFVE